MFDSVELQKRLSLIRGQLGPATTAFRLVDRPDVTVDHFAGLCVLSFYRVSDASEERAAADALLACEGITSVYLKRRPREARRAANENADEVSPPLPLAGAAVEALVAIENGIQFSIRPTNGLSVGLYLDAREARAWVAKHSAHKTVLNLFSYTCGFGLAALRGGATRAVNVDASRKVLDWGENNSELNQLRPERRDFISGDVFDWLARFAKKHERFDLIVLDPPGFSNAKGQRFSAQRDYAALVTAAQAVLAPSGLLLAMCNVENLSAAEFEFQVERGLTGRTFAVTDRFSASAVDFSQPAGLKCIALRVD